MNSQRSIFNSNLILGLHCNIYVLRVLMLCYLSIYRPDQTYTKQVLVYKFCYLSIYADAIYLSTGSGLQILLTLSIYLPAYYLNTGRFNTTRSKTTYHQIIRNNDRSRLKAITVEDR